MLPPSLLKAERLSQAKGEALTSSEAGQGFVSGVLE